MPPSKFPDPRIDSFGESAVLVRYDVNGYSEAACDAVHDLAKAEQNNEMWTNIIPAYDSVMFTFNPVHIESDAALARIKKTLKTTKSSPSTQEEAVINIPVFYGGEDGPDMQSLCEATGLRQETIIQKHSDIIYRVCLMGFIPGFTFLSATDSALHHLRHATPRANVRAGSIGIANWQTGIYGLESPGGWQIIGRTPLMIFDKDRDTPFALKAGDRVKFTPEGHAS